MRHQSIVRAWLVLLLLPTLVAFVTPSLCFQAADDLGEPQSDVIKLEQEEKIFVEIEKDEIKFGLRVDPNDSVWDLEREVQLLEGVPLKRIRLSFNKTWLNDPHKLSEYNVRAGSKLTLTIPEYRDKPLLKFIVRGRDDREVPTHFQIRNTVARLKDSIAEWAGMPADRIRLMLEGKELKNERKLIHYEIYDGTILKLGSPLEECQRAARVSVKTLNGATFAIIIDLAATVGELKEKIWARTGVPVGVQRLFANERVIAGEDHLCDLGLGLGSTVEMLLYSSRIEKLNQVARLQEPPVARSEGSGPPSGPIFREAQDAAGPVSGGHHHHHLSLLKDSRNWVAHTSERKAWDTKLFDPVAHLEPSPDFDKWFERNGNTIGYISPTENLQWDRLEEMVIARIKLRLALRPYRVSAKLNFVKPFRYHPGITLGGGSTEVGPQRQQVPLGADVNNWAPDAFSDLDVMRLFEVSESVRQVLAKSAQTGEGLLSIADQKRINYVILFNYLEALAGYEPSRLHDQPRDDEECDICRDELKVEPAIKMPCEHTFHADCLHSWVASLYQRRGVPSCPNCRRRFMFPYETFGRAELESPGFQGHSHE